MLFKSTFLQSSSIWKVMSALLITVRDAWAPTQRQCYSLHPSHSFALRVLQLIVTWHRWFKDVCRLRIWENLRDTGSKNTHRYSPITGCLCVTHNGKPGEDLHSNLMFLRFSGRSWRAIFNHSSSCLANFLITWVKLWVRENKDWKERWDTTHRLTDK